MEVIMKSFSLCCLFIGFLILICLPLHSLSYQFEITSVGTSAVQGNLTITNSSSQPVTISFPTSGHFDIYVDGSPSSVMYLQILTGMTVAANTTVVQQVQHYAETPFIPGWHTAQVFMLLYPHQAVGNTEPFYVESPQSDYNNLFYELNINTATATEVSATLSLSNLSNFLWYYVFPTSAIAELRVDGISCEYEYISEQTDYSVVCGDTRFLDLLYIPSIAISPGVHSLRAHLLMDGHPAVGPTVSFNIEPSSSVNDPVIPEAQTTVSLNPNPFRIDLTINSKAPGELSIRVYNVKGQFVKGWKAAQNTTWDGRDAKGIECPQGIYLLNIKTNTGVVNTKVIKLK